jgi:hypothetical protein
VPTGIATLNRNANHWVFLGDFIINKYEKYEKYFTDSCQCDLGFIGPNCTIPLDLCGAQFCLNAGECHFDFAEGSKCTCKNGEIFIFKNWQSFK